MPIMLLAGVFLLAFGVFQFMGTGLKDVQPENQGGNFSKNYDSDFVAVSRIRGVPFALLKAHAIAESSLKPDAYREEPATNKRPESASFGLMQILWWTGSERWSQFGVQDAEIGDGSLLYDPHTNIDLAAQLIRANLKSSKGNLRDAINMYNTGVKESVRVAPGGYVDKVLGYYETILKGSEA